MGAIRPWQLLLCLLFVALVVGGVAFVATQARRRR
jgi:hypothetical protein